MAIYTNKYKAFLYTKILKLMIDNVFNIINITILQIKKLAKLKTT